MTNEQRATAQLLNGSLLAEFASVVAGFIPFPGLEDGVTGNFPATTHFGQNDLFHCGRSAFKGSLQSDNIVFGVFGSATNAVGMFNFDDLAILYRAQWRTVSREIIQPIL